MAELVLIADFAPYCLLCGDPISWAKFDCDCTASMMAAPLKRKTLRRVMKWTRGQGWAS